MAFKQVRFHLPRLPLAAIAMGLVSSVSVQAQMLQSVASTAGGPQFSSTTAAASTNYTDTFTGSYAEAYARTDYGYNHAYSKINLPSPNSYFSASAYSSYLDSFSFFVTNGMAGLLTPTSVRYTVTVDGAMSLPTGFDSNVSIAIGSGNGTDGLYHATTTDVGASLFENTGTDQWQLNSSVSGTTYTSQSYRLVSGTDSITVALYAGVSADTSSFAGNGFVDFRNTAVLSGVIVYDQYGNPIPVEDLQINSTSGAHYAFSPITPEPSSLMMCGALLSAFGVARKRRSLRKKA